MRAALERPELPLLGICRGMQVMNIALGGDLEPHLPDVSARRCCTALPPRRPDHAPGARSSARGLFGEIFARRASFPVCSWHHQAVRTLGRGLRATAHAPDGVIEAVVLDDRPFALGVQWHPEMQALDDRAPAPRLRGARRARARAQPGMSDARRAR